MDPRLKYVISNKKIASKKTGSRSSPAIRAPVYGAGTVTAQLSM